MTALRDRMRRPPKNHLADAIRSFVPACLLMSGAGAAFGLRLVLGTALCAVLGTFAAGCSTQWYFSYAEAEQQQLSDRQHGRPERDVLVFYKDHLDPNSGQMEDVLESPELSSQINGKILCVLVKDFAPNQRYMVQYGVDNAPALVVVHPDGTYHARQGLLTAEEARGFLSSAVGPGSAPNTNVQILQVADYHWHGQYEDAVGIANRQNRPLFIVYKWWLSPESTELVMNRLSQPRVRRQFSEMVHCMLDWDYVPNRSLVVKYGVTKVPSMIIVRPDGTYHTLTGLPTVEQITRFAAKARVRGRPTSRVGRPPPSKPAIHWDYDFERVRTTARRQGRKMFVFCHSVFADASNRASRLLETPEAGALLSGAACCRLDWVVMKNRELAAPFGLREPPAYVVVRPDGTYHARTGPVTLADLSALLEAADYPGERPRQEIPPQQSANRR